VKVIFAGKKRADEVLVGFGFGKGGIGKGGR
jgi:hypothetical protein